jgi:tRNA dimethylallyltransferase
MLDMGALDEVARMKHLYDPALPAFKAIGVPELMAHLDGQLTLDEARDRATIATRQFAKRQRTWFKARMGHWQPIRPQN